VETRRPTSPGAEEILGLYFPVLDHGFVALVDYMGTDACVERAARVSYGYGTRKSSVTRGLLRYLRRHLHTTPSEMVEVKFHCCMPMFVARQWIRHRTACLSGDSELIFDLPGAQKRGCRQAYKVRIDDFFRMWSEGTQEGLSRMQLRSCDERTGEIVHTSVVDVWQSGTKPVFSVVLDNGYRLKMSKDHRCLTERGWLTLAEATRLWLTEAGEVEWDASGPALSVNGAPAHEGVWRGEREDRDVSSIAARAATKLLRRFAKVARIEYAGEEMTYDLEVAGPWHNFVANGFIVHNSVNEYSGRYSLIPMLFYTPSAEQLQTQSRVNNQGRSGESVGAERHAQAIRRWTEIREQSAQAYEWMTAENVARELARIDLPVSVYTQWYWKIDLHNLLHFLKLRVDAHAQWEIQEYGRVMAGMLKKVAPLSYEAWIDYDVCGARMSRMELEALRRLVEAGSDGVRSREGKRLDEKALAELGLSKRELEELYAKLGPAEVPDFELDPSRALSAETFAERFARAVPKSDRPPQE
jgi:flavin-dependent thymidylate synthase